MTKQFKYSPAERKFMRDQQRKTRANRKAREAYKKLEAKKP